MSVPITKRDKKRKAVVINSDTVNDGGRNGNGDSTVAQKRALKRQKSELANANRTKRTKEPSLKSRVEEMMKVASRPNGSSDIHLSAPT